MIVAVGSAQGSGAGAGRFAGPGAGSVVSRPGLLGRLGTSARVIVVSAPPGSGKTVLLRSWTGQAALTGRVAWVAVGRDERDPQRRARRPHDRGQQRGSTSCAGCWSWSAAGTPTRWPPSGP